MRQRGFTLVELLVVVGILAILAAILFPIFSMARRKAKQAICMNNQRQIAAAAMAYALDHNDKLPGEVEFWSSINVGSAALTCPLADEKYANSYVVNNIICGESLASFPDYAGTMVSSDGERAADLLRGIHENVAYAKGDLLKRHNNDKYLISYLDGHVELSDYVPVLVRLPKPRNMVLWLSADNGVDYDPLTKEVKCWNDQSRNHYRVVPLDKKHTPDYVALAGTLNSNPALSFHPPVNTPNMLGTPDVSSNWYADAGTIFIVYLPEGNDQYEYTVMDQSNGDPNQATRIKNGSGGGGSPGKASTLPTSMQQAGAIAFAGGGGGGGGGNNPSVTLSAAPTTINLGQSTTLTWSSTNATSVSSSNFGATTVSGTMSVSPTSTTAYTITVANGNKNATATVTVTVNVPPPTVNLTASQTTINPGDPVTLSWNSTNATSVVSSNFGAAGINGSATVNPPADITYTITVTNGTTQATATVTITVVAPAPTVTLTANPTSITAGGNSTLTWSSTNATAVVSSNFSAGGVNGTKVVTPASTTTYTITVTNGTQQATASVTVSVNAASGPTVTLTANPTTITVGQSTTLTWSSTNAQSVSASNFGAGDVNGTLVVSPTSNFTYSITVKKGGQQATATVSVTVIVPPPTITLSATPSTIDKGQSTTLSWSSNYATTVVSSNFGAAGVNGTVTVSPTANTTYTITVSNASGDATATESVTVNTPPPTVSLTANPTTINSGQSVTLTWASSNATALESSNFGATGLSGSKTVMPTTTTTYNVVVSNGASQATATVTVTVNVVTPTITLTANPLTISAKQSTQLTWASSNAVSVVSSNFGAAGLNGTMTVSPTSTTTYTITVSNGVQQVSSSVTVVVATGTERFTGQVSLFRKSAAIEYPNNELPYNTPILLTLESSSAGYVAYKNGLPWPPYAGGSDWQTPARFFIGGSENGSNARRRSFNGYIAEVIVYNRVLSAKERQQVERYLITKYGF